MMAEGEKEEKIKGMKVETRAELMRLGDCGCGCGYGYGYDDYDGYDCYDCGDGDGGLVQGIVVMTMEQKIPDGEIMEYHHCDSEDGASWKRKSYCHYLCYFRWGC